MSRGLSWSPAQPLITFCMLVSLMGSTRLRPTEKSLLFHTNMLLHTWLLSIRKNVAYYSLWWSLFLLYFSLSETVKISLSLLGGSWLPLEFGLLGCLMMSARSLMGSRKVRILKIIWLFQVVRQQQNSLQLFTS